jgi:hypothetical protein
MRVAHSLRVPVVGVAVRVEYRTDSGLAWEWEVCR